MLRFKWRIASVCPLSADAHDDAVAARHLREHSNGYWTAEARTATQAATQAPLWRAIEAAASVAVALVPA